MATGVEFTEIDSLQDHFEGRPGGYPNCPVKGSRAMCQFPVPMRVSGETHVRCTNPQEVRNRSNPIPCPFLTIKG